MSRYALAIAAVGALATTAQAHPMDLGYLRVDATGETISVALDLDVNLVALLGADPRDAGALANATYRAAPIAVGGRPCVWLGAHAVVHGRTVSVADRAECPAGVLRWPLPFVARAPSTFKLLVNAHTPGGERASIVERTDPVVEIAAGAPGIGFAAFVRTGIAHIGAAPGEWRGRDGVKLPDGIDHILFVLALLLAGGTIRQLAGVATGFTIGHSITLALSALHVARPPAAVIEPLIALSIAVVAAEAFMRARPKHRWKVATAFGLVHGFGFAGALVDLDLSTANTVKAVFGYNLGVELGQLAIIIAVAPVVWLAHRHPISRFAATRVAPALIFVAGCVWFVQRLC